MNLYTFPSYPGADNGYRKAVASDLDHFRPASSDTVIFFDSREERSSGGLFLARSSGRMVRGLRNLAKGSPLSEVGAAELSRALPHLDYASIICGEVIFYRALRKLFPRKHLTIRFHNYFSIVPSRMALRPMPLGLKYRYTICSMSRLERDILSDPHKSCVFITQEECEAAKLAWPGVDCEVLPISNLGSWPQGPERPDSTDLVLFGSLMAAHTRVGVDYFIQRIFIRQGLNARCDLHLFGSGTEKLSDPKRRIFGHGFHVGDSLPLAGKALYLVPDIHGVGIKMKVNDLLKVGACVLATPEAMFGHPRDRPRNLHVADLETWAPTILDLCSGRPQNR